MHCKENASVVTIHQKKKRGRGPTELRKIYDRDQPKQKVELNEFGQPVGSNGKTFANFIGTLVRKQLSVLIEDWRYVDPELKLKLWDDIKVVQIVKIFFPIVSIFASWLSLNGFFFMCVQSYFEVDEVAFDYFMTAAAKKWREFKSDLKEKFDATLTDEELMERRDERIQKDDWIQLIDQWRKPESEVRHKLFYFGLELN